MLLLRCVIPELNFSSDQTSQLGDWLTKCFSLHSCSGVTKYQSWNLARKCSWYEDDTHVFLFRALFVSCSVTFYDADLQTQGADVVQLQEITGCLTYYVLCIDHHWCSEEIISFIISSLFVCLLIQLTAQCNSTTREQWQTGASTKRLEDSTDIRLTKW